MSRIIFVAIESCSTIFRAKQLHHSVHNFIDKILSDNWERENR